MAGAFVLPAIAGAATGYERSGANLLNYGALIAFMGVNPSALRSLTIYTEDKKKLSNLLPPVLGFVICYFSSTLSTKALIFGAVWMAVGIAFGASEDAGLPRHPGGFRIPA